MTIQRHESLNNKTKTILNKGVLATNSDFLIPISLQHCGINILNFKLRLFYQTEFIVWNN